MGTPGGIGKEEKRDMHVNTTGAAKRSAIIATCLIAIAACGGGGSSSDSNPPSNPSPSPAPSNNAPSASAGPDQSVDEATVVTLDGSGSRDPDSDALTFNWSQVSGSVVTLSDASAASPTFTAPTIAAPSVELTFRLEVNDGVVSDTDEVTVTVNDTSTSGIACSGTDVCGTASYEFVPPDNSVFACGGLDFANVQVRPIRQATVQLLDSTSQAVIDSTTTDDQGRYLLSGAANGENVFVRVISELKRSGAPAWDVEVRDNVDTSPTPPPLENRPKYALDGAAFSIGPGGNEEDLLATTGWSGGSFQTGSYSGPRAAAPFSVLDAIYDGMRLMLREDPNATFPPVDAYWSANNALISGGFDIDNGEIPAAFYSSDPDRDSVRNPSLFLPGDYINGRDTEEFDVHVIVHEWGHYFEDNFSRSDSIGGPHAIGQRTDARLAFGEGWATALAGIALENQLYCDTNFNTASSGQGLALGTEDGGYIDAGWYDEVAILRFIYDLWDDASIDTDNDAGSPGSIGFDEMYDVLVNEQATTPAFTTIFSFANYLRARLDPTSQAFLDQQLVLHGMNPDPDIWGDNELANPDVVEQVEDVLPLYTDVPTDGTPVELCVNDRFDGQRTGNKLAQRRYLRLDITQSGTYDIAVNVTSTSTPLPADDPADPLDQSDPDVRVFQNGVFLGLGNSGVANSEVFTTQFPLNTGFAVASVQEFRYIDEGSDPSFPDRVCYEVTIAPN